MLHDVVAVGASHGNLEVKHFLKGQILPREEGKKHAATHKTAVGPKHTEKKTCSVI